MAALTVGVVALIAGVVLFTAPFGVALALIALALGGVGVARARRPNTAGTRAAVGGLLTGLAGLTAGGLWLAVNTAPTPSPTQGTSAESIREAAEEAARLQESVPPGVPRPVNGLAIGECFNSLPAAVVDQVFVVPCAQPHKSEVYAILDSPEGPGAPYPGPTVMRQAADGQCRADPYTDYIGGLDLFSRPQASAFHPNQERWAAGDRVIICTVSDPTAPGGLTTGSLRGSAERIWLPTFPPTTIVPRPLPPSPVPPSP
ncbi:MAG: septum formation family protein, partial [Egibacteraceae bacterium]